MSSGGAGTGASGSSAGRGGGAGGSRREAILAGYSVQFVTAATLAASLAKSHSERRLEERLASLAKPKLLIVDDDTTLLRFLPDDLVQRIMPAMAPRVKHYTKDFPIFEEYGVQSEIDKALPFLVTIAEKFDGKDRAYLEAFGLGCTGKEAIIYDALRSPARGRYDALAAEIEALQQELHDFRDDTIIGKNSGGATYGGGLYPLVA